MQPRLKQKLKNVLAAKRFRTPAKLFQQIRSCWKIFMRRSSCNQSQRSTRLKNFFLFRMM